MNEQLRQAIIAAQDGDIWAFGQIVERFQCLACAYAYKQLGDSHLAEDAAQEAFLETYAQLPNLCEPHAFVAWFRRIIFKQCDRLYRQKRLDTQPLTWAEQQQQPDWAWQLAEQRTLSALLQQVISQLAEQDQQVVQLFYLAHYTQHEIAQALGLQEA